MACNGNHKTLCSLSDCTKCFERSFASHEKSKYLVDNINPRSICKSTHKNYIFLCEVCWHFFENDLDHVTRGKNPRWCPYCSHTTLCEYDDCTPCYNYSFASHEKSRYLTDKTINPRNIFKQCNDKFIFTCENGHTFSSSICHVSNLNAPRWCPHCSKGRPYSLASIQWLEYIGDLQHYLSSLHGEYRIPGTNYKADGYCEKTNTIYEFHGDKWHGNPKIFNPSDICPMNNITYGELYEKTLKKKEYILSHGYKYVEIWETDWKRVQKNMRMWKKIVSKSVNTF